MSASEHVVDASVEVDVQFYDLDPMDVVWHGNYFRFFEVARCALLDRIGYSYAEMDESGYTWPIVDTRVKFIRPLGFRDRVRVTAVLEEFENRLKIGYTITDAAGQVTTRAHTVQVAVDSRTGEMCFVSPAVLVDKVRACR